MSELSFMEKLLDGVEVEWVELSEVVDFLKGKSLPKERIVEDGENKCIHYGELFTHYPAVISEVKSRTNQSLDDSVLSMANDVLMPTSDVTPNGLATASCLSEAGVILGGDILVIRGGVIDGKYLSHFIRKSKSKIMQMVKGSTVYHIYAKDLGKLLIPIPCPENPEKSLEIQAEIVRILDTFTELTTELTTELNARKKQYNYYRDQLLSFEEGDVGWKTLLDACGYVDYRGKTPTKTQEGIFLVTAKNIRMGYIDYKASQEFISEDNYDEVMRRGLPKKGDVLITTEAPCGFVAQVDRENIALAQRVIKYRSKDKRLSNSFLKHYLLGSQFQNKLSKVATGSTVKGVKGSKLHQLTIPIPSEDEQARIVSILDKFDALTNSITEGLPREIELRQQQYEYYRDLLLSFPKPEAAVAVA